jgi:DNA-binding NtrC family response regulator
MVPLEPACRSNPAAPKIRVLIVDDERSVARSLRRALSAVRPTWSVELADSSALALRLAEHSGFDVVVTDLEMPNTGGIELLRLLAERQPGSLRVLHSSHIEPLEHEELKRLAHFTFEKPGMPFDLVRRIEDLLMRHWV